MYVADILKTSIMYENMAANPDFIDFFTFLTPERLIFRA